MKTKLKIFFLVLLFLFIVNNSYTQTVIDSNAKLSVQPEPKEVVNFNKSIKIADKTVVTINTDNKEEEKGANYLVHLLNEKYGDQLSIEINNNSNESGLIKIIFDRISEDAKVCNDQYYEIKTNVDSPEITIKYSGQLGLLFAAVTLSECFQKTNDGMLLNLFDVKDYPDFLRRIISSLPQPDEVDELLDFALKSKIETIAIASRRYSWFKVDDDYKKLFEKIKEWKDKYGGPSIMQMHNIYEDKEIEISSEEDLAALKNVIKTGIENGADKLMILADDTPPFKFSEGYILTSENDKKKFKHMAEAHCYLMNEIKDWLSRNSLESELYYVPPFYTYEDMHYGDMELYKDTPWEDDAYKPLHRDLNYIGINMPEDVFILWTGPVVRSRTITSDDINDWTYNLKGRVPFLWDNTIYSHNPFISTPFFSAWDNDFPADFNERTAGNGMFINGAANSEDSKASVITVNDYMWNSKTYSPMQSLDQAMKRLYGKGNSELLLKLKETELELRKTIGERELWFESDTLWKIIRKIRFIHTKNPFYYHFNYTRMKALRLQLKGSVSGPIDKNEFVNKCLAIDKRRKEVLKKLEAKMPKVTLKLKKLLLELPDFNKVQ
ncbi:MAG: beta-N-acetylglucosaminidase domain-containing protein [Ignavibacteria bacterium]